MVNKACDLCGHKVELSALEKHYIVPREVWEQASIQRGKIARLCPNCSHELERWNSTKVADSTYDTATKQFRDKSPREIAKEYEFAYTLFAQYKKNKLKL